MAEVNARKRGNKWQYYFEGAKIDGKRQRICKSGFNTKKEALEAGVQALNQYNNYGAFVPKDVTVAEFSNAFLEYCEETYKWTTFKSYESVINAYVKPELGRYKIENVDGLMAEKFCQNLKSKGLAYGTIDKIITVFKSMFKYAVKKDTIKVNPLRHFEIPKNIITPQSSSESYTDKQIQEFLTAYKDEPVLYAIIMLGYHCGLRLSESLALTWEDVDFQNKTIRVSKQIANKKGILYFSLPKYNSVRTISIDDKMYEYLLELKQRKDSYPLQCRYRVNLDNSIEDVTDTDIDTQYVNFVVSKVNSSVTTTKQVHNKIDVYKHKGYPYFRSHWLRHTHCTKLMTNGIDLKYIQVRLGHKNMSTTLDIYTHLTDNFCKSETDKINKLF